MHHTTNQSRYVSVQLRKSNYTVTVYCLCCYGGSSFCGFDVRFSRRRVQLKAADSYHIVPLTHMCTSGANCKGDSFLCFEIYVRILNIAGFSAQRIERQYPHRYDLCCSFLYIKSIIMIFSTLHLAYSLVVNYEIVASLRFSVNMRRLIPILRTTLSSNTRYR